MELPWSPFPRLILICILLLGEAVTVKILAFCKFCESFWRIFETDSGLGDHQRCNWYQKEGWTWGPLNFAVEVRSKGDLVGFYSRLSHTKNLLCPWT